MRYSDHLALIHDFAIGKSRISALLPGLLLASTVSCSVSFAQDQDEALIEASKRANLKQVHKLLDNGANVNAKDRFGRTALMHAVI